MATWVFEKLAGAAVRRDPIETQLFRSEQAEEGEYAATDALVREILQNATDAATGDGSIRLRLALHPASDLPRRERLAHFFGRLESALRHREVAFAADGLPQLPEGFLVCEDFGTRGLGGDPLLARDPPSSAGRQDFFWFWRNIGRSGKTGDDLGRWGLGKTVYRSASRIGCMIGLTVRAEDRRELLMGQAVLKIHEHEGQEYQPEGFWCDGVNDEGLPLPIEDPAALAEFRREWGLTRRDEPGLSVVVPYVAAELDGKRLLQAVCVHFFLPILQGKLVVDLESPQTPRVRLDADSLAEWCRSLKWDGLRRNKRHAPPPVAFAEACLAARKNAVPSRVLGLKHVPDMTKEKPFEAGTLVALQADFAAERLVAARVSLSLPRQKGPAETGECDVFLQRSSDGERADAYYVREGMTITRHNAAVGRKGVRALVLVDRQGWGTDGHNSLAALLGDSEGPAHEEWDTSAERPDRQWKTWKGRVKFCQRIVDELAELLAPPQVGADFDLLSDVFSIAETRSPQRARRPAAGGTGLPDFEAIGSKPRWFRLEDQHGGFRIVRDAAVPLPADARLTVSVAYDLPSGNPLKKWSPFDFDFGGTSLHLGGEGVAVKRTAGNVLRLTVESDKFRFVAKGFDEHRDLFVKAEETATDNADDDESAAD